MNLNISSYNVVEPEIDEGPLNFIGRFWDKVKPRDNQILLNEHVGELRKPPQATLDGKPVEVPNPIVEKLSNTAVAGQISGWRTALAPALSSWGDKVGDLRAQAAGYTEKVSNFEEVKAQAQAQAAGLRERAMNFDIKAQAQAAQAQAAGLKERIGNLDNLKERIGNLDNL